MSEFRKKPIVINAWRHDGSQPLRLATLEGEMTAQPGDWIIIGVAGEVYSCKDDVFLKTYDVVTRHQEPS